MKIYLKKGNREVEIETEDLDLSYSANVDNLLRLINSINLIKDEED